MKRGDIYYITGGGETGSEQWNERPGIIVSNEAGNLYSPVVEIVYLTGKQKKKMPTHVGIISADYPSTALCEQISTVSKDRLTHYMGTATEYEMRQIDEALGISLALGKGEERRMILSIKSEYGIVNLEIEPGKAFGILQKAISDADRVVDARESECEMGDGIGKQERKYLPPAIEDQEFAHQKEQQEEDLQEFQEKSAEEAPKESETINHYKGFLLIKCQHCGKIKGFCPKEPISEYRCKCGGSTPLINLVPAHLNCKCGSHFKYKTNITDERFEYNCLECGSPVDLELNSRRNTYVTIGD